MQTAVRLFGVILAAAVALAVMVGGLFWEERERDRELHRQAALHSLRRVSDVLESDLALGESDVLYLADQPELLEFAAGNNTAAEAIARRFMSFAAHRRRYDQIRLLDAGGREVVRVNFREGAAELVAEGQLQSKADRYYFQEAMRRSAGDVYISPFDLNVEHGEVERPLRPVIRFATPLVDEGRSFGALVLNYRGDELLSRLDEIDEAQPGRIFLLGSRGDYLRGPSAKSEWGFALGRPHRFGDDFPTEWRAIESNKRVYQESDAGLFAAQRLVLPAGGAPAEEMIVVSHVPAGELYERSQSVLANLLLLAAGAMALVTALAATLARAGAVRRRQAEQIKDSEARLRRLSQRLMETQEIERKKIAHELHDDLAQLAAAISLETQRVSTAKDMSHARTVAERAGQIALVLVERIRQIAADVRPSSLDDLSLSDAIRSGVGELERSRGLSVKLDLDVERAVPAEVRDQLYRITQEALRNTSQHAGTSQARVELVVRGPLARLLIADAGQGFDISQAEQNGRMGLLVMRERAELLGGRFAVCTSPGEGTRITVEIPLPDLPSAADSREEG